MGSTVRLLFWDYFDFFLDQLGQKNEAAFFSGEIPVLRACCPKKSYDRGAYQP